MENIGEIADRFTEEREKIGYTRVSLAERLGVNTETLRLIEAGKSDFRASILAVAAKIGMDVQYILTGIKSKQLDVIENKIGYEKYVNNVTGDITGVGINVGGKIDIIHTTTHRTVTKPVTNPGEQHITVEQRAILSELVKQVVETEAKLKRKPKSYRAVWSALNKHCRVNSYTLIALNDFEKARKYLSMWLGRLNSSAMAPVKNGDEWRKKKYAYIHANSKEPEDLKAYQIYLLNRFNTDSLKELTNEQLEEFYRFVASRKSRKAKKGS